MNNKVVFFLMFFLLLYACSVEEEKNDNKTFIAKAGLANEYETSRQTLDAEISKNADNITALIARGNLALENYDFSNAFSDAARAFRLDSNNFQSRLLYARSLINRPTSTGNDKIVAQRHFLKLVNENANNLDAIVGLANTYALLQDFENANIWIEKALKIDSKCIDAYRLKGSIFKIRYYAVIEDSDSKKFAEALFDSTINTYSYITQIDPEYHVAYMHLGLLFDQRNDPLCLDHYLSAVQV
ncbi:MAG: hypothetical protein HOH34_04420, partial [Flavobacteriales bacterium]|nr:hypothetical protein [Flavobacteriales bacterium]